MPFFFDLSSLIPIVDRNPFAPVRIVDEVPEGTDDQSEVPAEPIIDTGLPIPSHYDIDLMRAIVQDPFHLFVHWQLRSNPFERLNRMFPVEAVSGFRTVLKLIDETNRIAVYFDAAFAREYWFNVFPARTYRVELGLRSAQFGYIKLLSSQSVFIPRVGPSDQTSDDVQYSVSADEYLRVLRESHLIPERGMRSESWFLTNSIDGINGVEVLPGTFREMLRTIADIQEGRDYDHLWERLDREELGDVVRDFLVNMSRLGDGELGYLLLLRYLPELLRRVVASEGEIQIDEPISLFMARRIGLNSPAQKGIPEDSRTSSIGSSEMRPWFPSATL
jgi:hypothetical protein